MKSRIFSILAVLTLLLSALPAGLVSAEQGTVTLDDTEYTNYTSGGTGSANDGENLVVVTVADTDLDTASSLPDDFEILGVADATATTFTTDQDDIAAVQKVFDANDGIAYFTAISEDNKQVTLNTSRAAVVDANVLTVTGITGNVVWAADHSGMGVTTATGDDIPTAATPTGKLGNYTVVLTSTSNDLSGTINIYGDVIDASTLEVTAETTTPDETSVFDLNATSDVHTYLGTKFYQGNIAVGFSGTADGGTVSLVVKQNRVIVARYTYDTANTTDYLDEDDATQQSLNLKSTTDPTGIDLTATETTATSGSFTITAVLVSEATKEAIDNEISAGLVVGTHTIDQLETALTTRNTVASLAADRVLDTVETDSAAVVGGNTISTLQAIMLVVAHDDVLTATYSDQGTGEANGTDTADIDANAPVLSNITPADGTFTDDETPEFTVTMVDADSGIDLTTLSMIVYNDAGGDSDVSTDVSTDPITDGYELTFIAGTSEIGADPGDTTGGGGLHDWHFLVKDAVGNVATTDDDDNAGADGIFDSTGDGTGDDKIRYQIDTDDPGLTSAITGLGLKIDPDDADAWTEFADSAWIKVTLSEDLDTASLAAADFEVDDIAPASILFGDDIENIADGAVANPTHLVYLEMATDLDSDATPEVEIVDDVDDKAGNDLDEADVDATDGIAPTLVVTVDTELGADEYEVTISMTSDEDLIASTVNVDVVNGVTAASTDVTMTKGAGNTWSGVFEINDSAEFTAEADAEDEATNPGVQDTATFEGDEDSPTATVQDAGGTNMNATAHTEAGTVWIVITYDEDDYTNDSYKTVTVSAVTLDEVDDDGDSVASITALVGDLLTSDDITFTLAKTLTEGDYEFSITAEDDAGNELTSTADFEVVAQDPFDLVLNPGVNLISIPGTPAGDAGALSTLFADTEVTSVITYDAAVNANGGNPWLTSTKDAAAGTWSGDVTALEPGKSYFIEATAGATIEILLEDAGVEVPPSVAVYQGWNAVGYWSISGNAYTDLDSYLISMDWSVAYSYDPTPGEGWKTLRADSVVADSAADGTAVGANDDLSPTADAGRGYLVYATADGTLTP